jgi:eukaryotic-like serine/threonine-protein kinase
MTVERRPGPNTRLFAAALCPDCQFSFIPTERVEVCPGCGRRLDLEARAGCETHLHHPAAAQSQEADGAVKASLAHEVDVLIGQQIDCYSCDALLGAGAMGRVYLARHLDLHRKCALKILPPSLVESDPAYVERFANEGRAAAALNHPNIVTVHAIGESLGYYFLEMEFVAGRSLRKLVEDDGPQTPVRATSLTLRIAEGHPASRFETRQCDADSSGHPQDH